MEKLNKELLMGYHKKYMEYTNNDKDFADYKSKFILLEDFDKLNANDFVEIAIGFANAWHSRTKKDIGVSTRTVSKLKILKEEFNSICSQRLIDIDLEASEKIVNDLYDAFDKETNSTARSKILHMLNRGKLFPIWDDSIRNHYGVLSNSQGYLNYMWLIQCQIRGMINKDIIFIEKDTDNTIVKVVDEYNWMKYTKNL